MTKHYISILRTNMSSLEFRLKKIDETRNYLFEEIKHYDLMSEKYKKTHKYLNCVEHLLVKMSIIKKKKKKYDKLLLLGKTKLDHIEVLISKAIIDSYISHDEFVSVNNVLRNKSPGTFVEHTP